MKWITAAHLEQWAETLPARTVFPALIADLVRASAHEITALRFPSGDKGQVRGFDGVLQAEGVAPYVPDGDSIWEFGVTGDVIGKADGDYKKRTSEIDAATRAQTTFVFATPRTWDRPKKKLADWLKEKRNLGEWKGVEYLDGVALEAWLAGNPAVAARYARFELRLLPQLGASSTDEFWQEYSHRFSPPLAEEVLLAGRGPQAVDLVKKLMERSRTVPLAADSPDEVVAFAVAAIRKADPAARLFLEAHTLVVDTEDAARLLVNHQGLVFLPRGQARRFAGLLAQSGPTIVSAGADETRGVHEVLARPNNLVLGKAFVSMGYSEEAGYDLSRRCGRSLAVLARLIPSGTAEPPEWKDKADSLLPALLAGAWKSSEDKDKKVLADVAGRDDYESVEAPLRALTKLKDPPVDRVGDVWAMRAPVDAFLNLAHLLGAEHLRRFSLAATSVFASAPPPPKADEVFRLGGARNEAHSPWLREGMMTILLHMAVLHEQASFTVQGSTPQDYVNELVRRLPGLSSDYRLMVSLSDQLALLAEAAPIPFLDALERLLEGDAMAIRPIFDEQEGFLSPESHHVGVLWALETLAWDPAHLLRASVCLARLAAIDPGGRLSNRPINSLREIFLTWAPNTGATLAQRSGILTHVIRTVPEIAWQLLAKLLPKHHDSAGVTHQPRFREAQRGEEVLTFGRVWEAQAVVVDLALQHVGDVTERWAALIDTLSELRPESLDRTLLALEGFLEKGPGDAQSEVWDALRKEAKRHRAFAGTEWALKEEVLARVEALVTKYQPEDLVAVSAWLFDDWTPDVPERVGADNPLEVVEELRTAALRDIYAQGIGALVQFALTVKLPQLVAGPLSRLQFSREEFLFLLSALHDAGEKTRPLTPLLVSAGLNKYPNSWEKDLVALLHEKNLSAADAAHLLSALPEGRHTWDLVASLGGEIEAIFWRSRHSYGGSPESQDLRFLAEKYLSYGRPLAALEALQRGLDDVSTELLRTVLEATVHEINEAPEKSGNMTGHYLKRAFSSLESRPDVTLEEIAKWEFMYLPFFSRGRNKKPLALHKLMVQNADTFMSLVSAVFKPANGRPEELTPEARRFASAAYELLSGVQIIPGQNGTDVDLEVLRAWCSDVRRIAREVDRVAVTDSRIGQLLAHAPCSSQDGAWPHEAVRAIIDEIASDELERGVVIERFNMRGVYTKSMGEGGRQERELAEQVRTWVKAMANYPRTAALLVKLADGWVRHAEQADVEAAKDSLKW